MEFSLFPTPIGDCGIAWRGDTVVATQLPEGSPHATASRMIRRTDASGGEPPSAIRNAIASITALLEGEKVDLAHIDCDLSGVDAFEASVYAAARAIPPGETTTYGAIALALGDKQLARKVGRALGRNPLPIIVPCHRVIGASGKLTGFSAHCGVDTKRQMLAIEGASTWETPLLFGELPRTARPRR